MSDRKRIKLTHGSARVDENCSRATIKALDQLSILAYEMENEPLNIDSVTNRYLFFYENEGEKGYTFVIQAKDYNEAYDKAYKDYGPQVESMMYRQL